MPYPDTKDEGLVSSIDDRQPPMLNWIYVDIETYEVKYGVRREAQPNLTVPFDCTKYDKRLTLEGWEGFVALEEEVDVWALYFDKDQDCLARLAGGRQVLQVQLTRSERREVHVVVNKTQLQRQERQEKNERMLKIRTGSAIVHDFKQQKAQKNTSLLRLAERLPIKFEPPFDSAPSVALGLCHNEQDTSTNQRLNLEAETVTESGFEVVFKQWYDTTIYEAGVSWFATTDPDFQIGVANTKNVSASGTRMKRYYHVNFSRSFAEPPAVACWLSQIDLYTGQRYSVTVWASDVDESRFVIHFDALRNSDVWDVAANWIAFPRNKRGVDTGTAFRRALDD